MGHTYIQHFEEKSLLKHEYQCIAGYKKSQVDRQGELVRDLCACAGIRMEDYNNGSKTFGMKEVKVFAQFLAPRYGIAVHNSLSANSKVFETSTSEDQKLFHGSTCLILTAISIPSQSHRVFSECIIGANSATSVTMTS